MPSWELWGPTGWREIWRLLMQSSRVGTSTDLPLDPMVSLRILRDS